MQIQFKIADEPDEFTAEKGRLLFAGGWSCSAMYLI